MAGRTSMTSTILEAGTFRRQVVARLRRLGFVDRTFVSDGAALMRGRTSRYLSYPGTTKTLRVSDHSIPLVRHKRYANVAHTVTVPERGTPMEADRIAWQAAQHFHRNVERRPVEHELGEITGAG